MYEDRRVAEVVDVRRLLIRMLVNGLVEITGEKRTNSKPFVLFEDTGVVGNIVLSQTTTAHCWRTVFVAC